MILNILIVDGDANFRSGLGHELKNAGHRVAQAPGARRALEVFPQMDFDVVIAELSTPEVSGTELIRKLRERKFRMPVILTSDTLDEEEFPFEQYGAAGILKKPFTPQRALAAIQKARESTQDFRYFLNVRRTLTVVSWVGDLAIRQAPLLEKCGSETAATRSRYVILNLHGFTDYDAVLAGDIVKFQNTVRNIPAMLLVCGLREALRERMSSKGLIAEVELRADLQAALQYLVDVGLKG